MMTPEQAKFAAISAAGGARDVAERLGLSFQAIYKWRVVPANRVMQMVELSRGLVSREELRPDVFGKPQSKRRKRTAA